MAQTDSYHQMVANQYILSSFTSELEAMKILSLEPAKAISAIKSDPVYALSSEWADFYNKEIATPYNNIRKEIDLKLEKYTKAQMEVFTEKRFYPDANSTLRVAYGNVKTTITETIPTGAGIITVDAKRTGYVIGGGVERATNFFGLLGPGWTAKSEYLYVDLGAHAVNYTLGGVAHTFSTDTHQHIFRSGLNYHFNQPIVAKF